MGRVLCSLPGNMAILPPPWLRDIAHAYSNNHLTFRSSLAELRTNRANLKRNEVFDISEDLTGSHRRLFHFLLSAYSAIHKLFQNDFHSRFPRYHSSSLTTIEIHRIVSILCISMVTTIFGC